MTAQSDIHSKKDMAIHKIHVFLILFAHTCETVFESHFSLFHINSLTFSHFSETISENS